MEKIPFKLKFLHIDNFRSEEGKFQNGIEVKVNSGFSFSVDFKEHLVRCISEYSYLQEETTFLKLELSAIFEIEKSAFDSMIVNNKLTLPVFFLRYMATFSVGVARGVILTKAEGTVIESLFLPQMNLVETINKDSVFELPKSCGVAED